MGGQERDCGGSRGPGGPPAPQDIRVPAQSCSAGPRPLWGRNRLCSCPRPPHGRDVPLPAQGAQLLLGQDAHLHDYEHGGAAQVSMRWAPLCSISPAAVETSIVMGSVQGPGRALRAVSEEEEAEAGQAVSVLLLPWTVRALGHRNISARGAELARRKLEFVARKRQEELALGLHPAPPGTGGA